MECIKRFPWVTFTKLRYTMTTMVCACCYKELLLSGVLLFIRLCLFIYLFFYNLFRYSAALWRWKGLHQISRLRVKLLVMANVLCMSCHNKATNCRSQLLFKFLKPLRSTFFQVIFYLKKIEKKCRHDIFLVSYLFFLYFFPSFHCSCAIPFVIWKGMS